MDMKRCSRCKHNLPIKAFSSPKQNYCKACKKAYGQSRTKKKPRIYCKRLYVPKVWDTIYAYNDKKLHPACPVVVTGKTTDRDVFCSPWTFNRSIWVITQINYGPRWPVVDSEKFRSALCAK